MSQKRIWYAEQGYLGSTGYRSPRDLAEAMLESEEYRDIFESNDDPQSLDEAEAYLVSEGIRVDHVPVSVFPKETWESNFIRERMGLDDKPGRGYVRVLGVNLS